VYHVQLILKVDDLLELLNRYQYEMNYFYEQLEIC
jgi:hypothetical protein